MTIASLFGMLVFFVGFPAVTIALFMFPRHHRWFMAAMVFTICYVKKPFYQEVFFVNYRGVDRGFAVTMPDLFFFGFFVWILLGGLKKKKIRWLPFNSLPWFLLILVSCFSLIGSLEPFYGLFTIHKMIRCWILYFVIVNLVRDRRDVEVILAALAATIILEGTIVVWDKYITGRVISRSIGSFRHPNTLALYTDLILPVLTAVILTSAVSKKSRKLFGVAILMGIICVVFTKSRGALVLLPSSLGAVIGTSILMRPTGRKFMVLGLGMVVVAVITAIALPKLIRRFQTAPEESAQTREYFNYAAEAMARENLFGVGINLYSHSLAHTDYYWYVYPDYVDVEDPEEFKESDRGKSRLGTAHHIYWLWASETGYPGVAVFVLHIGLFSLYTVVAFFREKDHLFKSVFLGVFVSTSFFHLHGLLEWIFRQTEVMYLYFILMGTVVAMVQIRKEEKKAATVSKGRKRVGQKSHSDCGTASQNDSNNQLEVSL